MNYLRERIGEVLHVLRRRIWTDVENIGGIELCECDYKGSANTPPADAEWKPFEWGATFGGTHEWHGWFRANVKVPERMQGKPIELRNWVSRAWPQVLTYINGKTVQGGDANHRDFLLEPGMNEFELTT